MIKEKTLLILGAGASVPYGYPTGDELRTELCEPRNLSKLLENSIKQIGLKLFCDTFMKSQINSIDSFLAKRGEEQISDGKYTFGKYAEIGKLAIANRLNDREDLPKLLEPDEDHWLQYLWNHMGDASANDFSKNQLKIISFNYDRVIEQYFQIVIEHSYGLDQKSAFELRKSIEIVHVYGVLQEIEDRAYGKVPTFLKPVADCIKVIPEARENNDEQFMKAKEMIKWAEKICFIGFGFDETNVRRLGFPGHDLSNKKIYSTFYGKTIPEQRKARTSIGWKVNPHAVSSVEQYSSFKTLEYIRQIGVFL